MQLRIDPEFESRIPPLTDDEFQQLEENILADGVIISPIVVWEGVVIDGHNRFRIVEKHPHISFPLANDSLKTVTKLLPGFAKISSVAETLPFSKRSI